MTKRKDPYRIEVGNRLRITAAELGFPSAKTFADYLQGERGKVDAWFNGQALPPVEEMLPFCAQWGLTLDWIYKGDPAGLTLARNIRLVAATQGMNVPAATQPDRPAASHPEASWAEPDSQLVPARKPVRRKPRATS